MRSGVSTAVACFSMRPYRTSGIERRDDELGAVLDDGGAGVRGAAGKAHAVGDYAFVHAGPVADFNIVPERRSRDPRRGGNADAASPAWIVGPAVRRGQVE